MKVWMDGDMTNFHTFSRIEESRLINLKSPISLMKSCKNPNELDGLRSSHLRDGAALCDFFCWLESEVKKREISEVEIDERLIEKRTEHGCGTFLQPSFPTIAGVNSNGAIIHYRALSGNCKSLTANDLLLVDSGAQYTDGTTDVTRTIHMGNPTSYQKEMFTRVLKGSIALDSIAFPRGTPGCSLDILARQHLWAISKDYNHGTGHGVGAALNVHEGPQRISKVLDPIALLPGMVVSNEPGYYEPGNFGIRIENLLVVKNKEKEKTNADAKQEWLEFETLTMCPIQKKLIDIELLTEAEILAIDAYHLRVRNNILPLLKSQEQKDWLLKNTQPIA